MKQLQRWIIGIALVITCVSPVFAQYSSGAPWGKDPFAGAVITGSDRTVLHGDIVHYCYDVVVGPGDFDKIQIHRVVREQKPFSPINTVDGVFLLPGSPNLFQVIFIPPTISPSTEWDLSFAVFLAKNNIDVWGMSYGWLFVPPDTTDFEALKGWGFDKDARHAGIALAIARRLRTLSGQGFGRLHLLGFSYGVFVAYAVAGEETQMPPGQRNVKGIIPVDSYMKYRTANSRAKACARIPSWRALLDAGVYQEYFPGADIGNLAQSAPDGPSPFFAGLTNFQAALELGMGGFVTGIRDAAGKPENLVFTAPVLWVDLLRHTPAYRAMQYEYDLDASLCDDPQVADVAFDDHLGQISVPILYVGRNTTGVYTTTRTASNDISSLIVTQPNLSHADLFLARDAESAVWKPILDWILAHPFIGFDENEPHD